MLEKHATVYYDGQVFKPEVATGLEPHRRYLITIIAEAPPVNETAWDVPDRYAGSIEGPGDLSTELDHYLYGTPKRDHEAR